MVNLVPLMFLLVLLFVQEVCPFCFSSQYSMLCLLFGLMWSWWWIEAIIATSLHLCLSVVFDGVISCLLLVSPISLKWAYGLCWLSQFLLIYFCRRYPGLSAILLTLIYCFRFFRSFANKVELTKADLQGREGFCFLASLTKSYLLM